MKRKGTHLLQNLQVDQGAAGVFGICYSVITCMGVLKGLGLFSPTSWVNSVAKAFENGHATTFLIDINNATITLTGMADGGWVFNVGPLRTQNWARDSDSATTYVYYVCVDASFIQRYQTVKNQLLGTTTSYAVLWPNLMVGQTRYENCVSHSHYLMTKLGLAYWPRSKGWWVPSISNWALWVTSFVPTWHGQFWWKYKYFPKTNTHIP